MESKKYKLRYVPFQETEHWALYERRRFLFIGYWKMISLRKSLENIEQIYKILIEHPINSTTQTP